MKRAVCWTAAAAAAYLIAGRVLAPVLVARALRTDILAELPDLPDDLTTDGFIVQTGEAP